MGQTAADARKLRSLPDVTVSRDADPGLGRRRRVPGSGVGSRAAWSNTCARRGNETGRVGEREPGAPSAELGPVPARHATTQSASRWRRSGGGLATGGDDAAICTRALGGKFDSFSLLLVFPLSPSKI